MRILICVEFFYPSVGGAQEVVKQLALRFAGHGHDVTIATSEISERVSETYNNLEIQSFGISGNWVNGIVGEVDRYRAFVKERDFDVLFIYAAQQWTFDSLIGHFGKIRAKKIFVPCGFSALYDSNYSNYFSILPEVLSDLDALVFHSMTYRDYIFAEANGLKNLFFIPNGADNFEFNTPKYGFRDAYQISKTTKLLMTVGSLNGAKGHLEIAEAFSLMEAEGSLLLVLNGNKMSSHQVGIVSKFEKIRKATLKQLFKSSIVFLIKRLRSRKDYFWRLNHLIDKINSGSMGANKKVILTDLPRDELISCYFEANIFVFASNIEYSPLVLFEAAAAGLPFITVDVGNSLEIVKWTKGGVICPSRFSDNGNTLVNPTELASHLDKLISKQSLLQSLGREGRRSWEENFNWDCIAKQYEQIFINC